MKLWEYLDFAKLEGHVENGLVQMNMHKEIPLFILSYGRRAVLENIWDDVTCKCRGLIVNSQTYDIVARPFEKFFDFGKQIRWDNAPLGEPVVLDKLNGSLGILYVYNGVHSIASKGSFHSCHAIWATDWYRRHVVNPQWPEGYTPVFEMICEHIQKHAVYYGENKLVLLALIKNETGEEADYNTLYYWAGVNGLQVPEIFGKSLDDILIDSRPNAEGYVASWPRPGQPPLKIKVKFAEFLRLRQLIRSATPRAVFEALSVPRPYLIQQWLENSTPWLQDYVADWIGTFKEEYRRIASHCQSLMMGGLAQATTRKEFAQLLKQHEPYAGVCFAMLDERDYKSAIWELVEPLSRVLAPVMSNE